jgi:DNA-binding transcriptional LysR family regulator
MKVFYVVAKYQNISHAAKELDVSQPAVSRIISNIEQEYKTKLFSRSKNGVTLTREGLNLYEMIKSPFIELEKIESGITGISNLKETVVHVGATATALYCYVFKFLDEFKKQFPLVNIRLYTSSSIHLLNMVERGEIDFAFITSPFNVSDDIELHNINTIKTILIAPISYKDKIKGPTHIKSLEKYPFILLNKDMQFREHINQFLNKYKVKINPVYEIDSSSMTIPLVENDCGLTFTPSDMAEQSIKEGKSFQVDLIEQVPDRFVSFVIKKDASYSNIIYDIKTAIITKFKEVK